MLYEFPAAPPWFSLLPDKQLKAAEKSGVEAIADLIVYLRRTKQFQDIEIVFFKHDNRMRYWEQV